MLFNSGIFVVFLALVLPLNHVLPERARVPFLLAASVIYYGWHHPPAVLLLLASTLVSYTCGQRVFALEDGAARLRWAAAGVGFELAMLGFFKYTNFAIHSAVGAINWATGEEVWSLEAVTLNIFLPVGISFYAFKSIGYIVSLYKREMPPARSLLTYALYVAYFPQLNAGPVEKARHLLPQIEAQPRVRIAFVMEGVFLILLGYVKKVVIADWVAKEIAPFFEAPITHGPTALVVMLLFTLQIYTDFSAYSDIAIGIGRLMGYHIRPNFNLPFVVPSIPERWRRWHISMSVFFREHIFIPLGGSRHGEARTQLNVMIVMLLSGLWHGASWNFVVWGLLNGAAMVVTRRLEPGVLLPLQRLFAGPWYSEWGYFYFRCAVTYVLISLINIFFRAPDFTIAGSFVAAIFTDLEGWLSVWTAEGREGMKWDLFNGLGMLALVVIGHEFQRHLDVQRWVLDPRRIDRWVWVNVAMFWLIVNFGVKGGQFIYYQF